MHGISNLEILLRIVLALFLGGALGFERGLKNRPAGIRTYILVCLGSCVVMMTGQCVFSVYGIGDPARIGAQVVSGIGFLGAGSIIVTRHNQVKGLTTAAGLWAAACIGLALGMGFYEIAFPAAVSVFIVLTLMQHLDTYSRQRSRVLNVYIELDSRDSLGEFLEYTAVQALGIRNIQAEQSAFLKENFAGFVVTIESKVCGNHQRILDVLKRFEHIRYVEEI